MEEDRKYASENENGNGRNDSTEPETPSASVKEETETPVEARVVYRWDYSEQTAFDRTQEKKRHRRGTAVYAAIMSSVFSVCILLLVLVLIWQQIGSGGQLFAPKTMTVEQVAQEVLPTTVLILANGAEGTNYGTGFFIRSNGYIATNAHVIYGASDVRVALYSGETVKATLVDAQEGADIALLKIDGENYPVAAIGNSDTLTVGERAIVLGNPGGIKAPWSTTAGTVSALNRRVALESDTFISEMTMIQTDAAVNNGNSGGPLCNDRGEIVGIVTRKLTDYEGIGFAIPINGAMKLLDAMADTGNADQVEADFARVRPRLDFKFDFVTEGQAYYFNGASCSAEFTGFLVRSFDSGKASTHPLKVGDLVYEFDGKRLTTEAEFLELLYDYGVGAVVPVTVLRNGTSVQIQLRLGVAKA